MNCLLQNCRTFKGIFLGLGLSVSPLWNVEAFCICDAVFLAPAPGKSLRDHTKRMRCFNKRNYE